MEIIDRKRSRSNPNREVKVITIPAHLDDVEPKEQDLDADPSEAGDNGLKERQGATSNAGEREKKKKKDFSLGLLRLPKTVGGLKFFKGKVVFLLLVRCQ